ncbi:hypothetical protein [Sphingobacteruim zhuxiongii]|nr:MULTISPECIES: hypothetical protein [unclassified Sphingobacterium]
MMKQRKEITGARVLKIALLEIFGGISLFCFLLYMTVKTKSTSLQKEEPFQAILNKPQTLLRDVELFDEELSTNDDFPNIMTDQYQHNFTNLQGRLKIPKPDVTYIAKIPAGQQVVFRKAIMYTNGVSGGSTPCLFGTIRYNDREYKVEYQWGDQSISRRSDNIPESWSFAMAPWQPAIDLTFYELPIAEWW